MLENFRANVVKLRLWKVGYYKFENLLHELKLSQWSVTGRIE